MTKPHEDLTGQTFGLWEPLELVKASPGTRTRWLCQCSGCGRRQAVLATNLKAGRTRSCRWCRGKMKP